VGTLKSQSNTLTITTGLPTQDFFSLSVQTYNIEGWDYDGTTSALLIIASDRLGNPVPDGTAVNFITPEGSQITPASCTTKDGTCSVTFKSSAPRPSDGRVSILAYAIGEKSFVDLSLDNIYDSGETFYDIGDPYVDYNENDMWDSGEFSIASTTAGSSACRTQPGATALPGSYGNALSKENTCTAAWGQNYVRRNAVLVLSGSYADLDPFYITMGACSRTVSFWLHDENDNPMPAGTAVALTDVLMAGIYTSGGTKAASAAAASVGGTPVLNTNQAGGTLISFTISGGTACTGAEMANRYPAGTANIVVTTPKDNITTIPFAVVSPSLSLTASRTSVLSGVGSSITATLYDAFGNPASGVTLNFSFVNNSGGTLAFAGPPPYITDVNGQVTATYTAGTTTGVSDRITASSSASGYESSDFVTITVLAPPTP
jgi:hypothetical protein